MVHVGRSHGRSSKHQLIQLASRLGTNDEPAMGPADLSSVSVAAAPPNSEAIVTDDAPTPPVQALQLVDIVGSLRQV